MDYSKDMFIIDIDNCIMESVFPNTNQEVKDIEGIINKSKGITIYKEFIDIFNTAFYKAKEIFFLTSRKESEYGELTKKQLAPLNVFRTLSSKYPPLKIIFYPEDLTHETNIYDTYKLEKSKDLIYRFNGLYEWFHIIDDMIRYYEPLFAWKEEHEHSCKLYQIKQPLDWIQFSCNPDKLLYDLTPGGKKEGRGLD